MDTETLKYFSQLGSVGILALVFYYQNNKNSLEYANKSAEQAKLYAEEAAKTSKTYADRIEAVLNIERGRTEMLVTLVKDNSSQTATNNTLMQALHARLDREGVQGGHTS